MIEPIPVIHDYALLKLKEKVPTSNFIKLSGSYDPNDKNSLTICGYPSNQYRIESIDGKKISVSQWGLTQKNKVLEIRKNN